MGLTIGGPSAQIALLNNNRRVNQQLGQATERLSTGLRINRASDDPAGLIEAEHLRGDLADLNAKIRVTNRLQQQVNIEQSGRQIASDVLTEVRGLLVEASNLSSSDEQRQAIQQQIDQSLDALDRVGTLTGAEIPVELESLRSSGANNVVDGDVAQAAEVLDEQRSAINQAAAAAGAFQKYTLEVDQRLAEDQKVIAAQALSQQADASFAEETSNLIRGQILSEASIRTIVLSQQLDREGTGLLFDALL